jgi:small-conductance mechanosensitive channel
MTVGIGFADNVGSFFTGIGLISTALVFTLQDFVASFFGWLHIKVGHLYATNDDITLHTNTSKYSGKVIHIGIFRTVIKVRRGDDGFDSEQPTGRTVSFPNHLVLKDSVDNSTLNNKILWHSINYTVVMESDAVFVKSLIKQVCEKQFQYSLDHNQIQDYSQNKKHIYKPKIYLDIAPEGKRFTIWFACNIGFYRDAVNGYSFDILEVFDRYNVQLAYPTQRLIVESPTMPKHVF